MQVLDTHTVKNQVPNLINYNLFSVDIALQEALKREGASFAESLLNDFGAELGKAENLHQGHLANKYPPELHLFDRFGHRIDEVEFHPAYHNLMGLGKKFGIHSIAWTAKSGGHVAHSALEYLLTQVEAGICCPITMTYASIPSLEHNEFLKKEWIPKIIRAEYDARFLPAEQKTSLMIGMAMTEKQGGSDVRTNETKAVRAQGDEYELTGHKWFCSAPMLDAFLTLAQTEKGLTCFFVPRFLPDGTKNRFFIQRLKDKLGNKANASSEIEFSDTWALRVGEEGRGIATIIEMVHHTRLDCSTAAVGLMRQALTQAVHHAQHRKAFGKLLINQPLMQNVLADLAIEWEASLSMVLRVARGYDQSDDADAASFARLAVAVAKYWTNKRCAYFVNEAMECLGGAGYVEESILPRLYREAPLNGIWEGSGNVICLDVLRTFRREPNAIHIFLAELEKSRGKDPRFDVALDDLKQEVSNHKDLEFRARMITEKMAQCLQAALLLQHGNGQITEGFLQTRLAGAGGRAFGTLPQGLEINEIIERICL